ncbi:MAG: hypothetical protein ACRYFE_03195 [Janthinobacterium lividum]
MAKNSDLDEAIQQKMRLRQWSQWAYKRTITADDADKWQLICFGFLSSARKNDRQIGVYFFPLIEQMIFMNRAIGSAPNNRS